VVDEGAFGATLGLALGLPLGLALGLPLGLALGLPLGLALGLPLGLAILSTQHFSINFTSLHSTLPRDAESKACPHENSGPS